MLPWPKHYPNCIQNRLEDVYPYSEAYDSIENLPIVSGDTAYDDTDGNTYVLLFHESIYYVLQMKHIIINPNNICFNFLAFYDNPAIDADFYVELNDDL